MLTNCDFVATNYAVYFNSSSAAASVYNAPAVYLLTNCQVDQGSGSGLPANSCAFYFDCTATYGAGSYPNRGQVTISNSAIVGEGSNSPIGFYMKNVSQLTLNANTSFGNYATFAELVNGTIYGYVAAIVNSNHTAGGSIATSGGASYNGTNYS